jgi:hypothetical protein
MSRNSLKLFTRQMNFPLHSNAKLQYINTQVTQALAKLCLFRAETGFRAPLVEAVSWTQLVLLAGLPPLLG